FCYGSRTGADFSAALISSHDGARQMCMVPATLPAVFIAPIALPSGEIAVDENTDPWPSNVSTSCQLSVSQSFNASLPAPPATRRLPSPEKATEVTPRR